MPNADRRPTAGKRMRPRPDVWRAVLEAVDNRCVWVEGATTCGLQHGALDPVGCGTVRRTPDHKTPHSVRAAADSTAPSKWHPLCGRHQVVKRNSWDSQTGEINVVAIVQAASAAQKREVFEFLSRDFETERRPT